MTYYVFSSAINLVTAIYLGLVLAKNKSKYVFYILDNLSVAFWALFYLLWQVSTNKFQALLFCQLLTVGSIFMPYFFTLFIKQLIPKNIVVKQLSILNNILIAILIPLTFSKLIICGVEPILNFPFWPKAGPAYPFFLVYFIGNFLFDFCLLLWEYTVNRNKDRTFIYILVAIVVAFVGGSTNYFLWFNILIPPYGNILLSVHVSIITFAILKHELLDIKLALTKFASYSITSAIVILSYLAPLYFLPKSFILLSIIIIPLSFFWALYFRTISDFLITSAKRKFFKGYYEADKVLETLTESISAETDRNIIFSTLEQTLSDTLELEHAAFIIATRDTDEKLTGYRLHGENTRDAFISADDELIVTLATHHHITFLSDLEIASPFTAFGFSKADRTILMPIHSPEMLEGLIILGEKSSEKPFNDEDMSLLRQINIIVTSVFYKLTPYEKIQSEFEGNQKKLHDSERNLARTEKIASLARVIQEYNHEIKTPLSILGLTVHQLKDGDSIAAFKEDANRLIARANDIVETTLRISKPREHQDVAINLIDVIEEALKLFPPDGVKLIKQFAAIPAMMGDPDDLHILFTNLFKNAYEAMPNGGTLTVQTSTITDNYATYASVKVSDTGVGIEAENLERIWDPFFSTHVTSGRGLGLSLAFRIAREHLGSIQVESTVGKGSTFTIQLKV